MITVVNIRTAPPDAIYIGRDLPNRAGSPLGNPFRPVDPNSEDDRQLCLRNYKQWLWEQMRTETPAAAELQRLATLAKTRDIALACWCAPKSCHGDVVRAAIEYLNRYCAHAHATEYADGYDCLDCGFRWRMPSAWYRAVERVFGQVAGEAVAVLPGKKKERKAALEAALGVVWYECLRCKGKTNSAGFPAAWRWKKEETLRKHKCLGNN